MSQLREPGFDRAVALVLRIGAFSCFFIMLAGVSVGLFDGGHVSLGIERAGVSTDAGHASRPRDRGVLFILSGKRLEVWMDFAWGVGDSDVGVGVWNRRALERPSGAEVHKRESPAFRPRLNNLYNCGPTTCSEAWLGIDNCSQRRRYCNLRM